MNIRVTASLFPDSPGDAPCEDYGAVNVVVPATLLACASCNSPCSGRCPAMPLPAIAKARCVLPEVQERGEKAALKDKYLAYDSIFSLPTPPLRAKEMGRHSARTRFTKSYR
ncbi:hypothetical protein TcBrA4_0106570 [Trypanosoma cruzi]|nr:hypothetical protein TcBrA4_0106570 [Trypanosoma cruzi]